MARAPADEYPAREHPDLANWSENYWFVAYDPKAEIGIWSHQGRTTFDPTLWREISVLYLPGGERLLTKGYGRGETERGPGSASLTFTCVEPWNRWETRLDGAAVRSTAEALDGAIAADGIHEPISYELDWRAASPVWEMGEEMREQSWGHVHYQQVMRVTGTIRLDGEEIPFSAGALRDHTRGPRDYGTVKRHMAAHGVFEDGRAFILIDVDVEGARISRGVLVLDGELQEAELRDTPFLASHANGSDPYTLRLGHTEIEAEILHNMAYGFAGANDVVLGWDPAVATHSIFEGMTRFTWGDAVGHGLTERSVRD